jgi:hypothetical protein
LATAKIQIVEPKESVVERRRRQIGSRLGSIYQEHENGSGQN